MAGCSEYELNHFKMVMQSLQQHRRSSHKLCDLNLQVGERTFPVHRSVLAASSAYFSAMFCGELKESRQKMVELKDVKTETLELILDFSYSGEININSENVEEILSVSRQFQFDEVCNLCCNFLEMQLEPTNCINIRKFVSLYHCSTFTRKIDLFIGHHFMEVVTTDDFCNLPFEVLKQVISSNKLKVYSEETVYTAVIKWVRFDTSQRSSKLCFLLEDVRLPLLSKKFLMKYLGNEELIKSDMKCRDLLDEAKNYHIYPEIRSSFRNKRTIPRHFTEGALFAIGGKEAGEEITNKTECYSMFDDSWYPMAPLWCRRQQLGVCVLNNKIYAIAGSDGDNRLDTVEVYDYETNAWKNTTPLQTCRSGVGVGVLGGAIYALGGYDGRLCLNSVERFDPAEEKWSFLAPTNYARSFPGVVALDGRLYVIGGNDGSTFLDTCERYDPHTNKWSVVTPMNVPRAGVGCAVLDGLLYAAGGFDGTRRLNLVEQYNPCKNTWTTLSPMTSCRDGVSMMSYCGYLFAIGGIDGPSYLNSVEYYDPSTDSWTQSKEMITSRAAAGVAVLSNDIICNNTVSASNRSSPVLPKENSALKDDALDFV